MNAKTIPSIFISRIAPREAQRMPNDEIVIAFDAYGTLLDTSSIAEKLASYVGDEQAKTIAGIWRKYQLEYTWRLNSMRMFKFSLVVLLATPNTKLTRSLTTTV